MLTKSSISRKSDVVISLITDYMGDMVVCSSDAIVGGWHDIGIVGEYTILQVMHEEICLMISFQWQ